MGGNLSKTNLDDLSFNLKTASRKMKRESLKVQNLLEVEKTKIVEVNKRNNEFWY